MCGLQFHFHLQHVESFDEISPHFQCKTFSIKSNVITCVLKTLILPRLCIFIVHHLSVLFRGCNSFHKLLQNMVRHYVCLSVCISICFVTHGQPICDCLSRVCVSVCISHAICVYCLYVFKYACRSQITHHLFHFHPVAFLFSYWIMWTHIGHNTVSLMTIVTFKD